MPDSPARPRLDIRLYAPEDRCACLALFDGNSPDFFAPSDRAEFSTFLEHPDGVFLVGRESDGAVVACGGWYVDSAEARAGLTWGMVDRSRHRCGFGRVLLEERLRQIRGDGRARWIRLRTTPPVRGFFERFGFAATKVVRDGLGAGLDLVEMERTAL